MGVAADTTRWVVLAAIVFFAAGIKHDVDHIEVFSVKVERSFAFLVAIALYVTAEAQILDAFLRMCSIVHIADDEHVEAVATRICLHPWSLNPFLTLADGAIGTLLSMKGIALLVFARWFCYASLQVFEPVGFVPWWALLLAFILYGGVLGASVHRVLEAIERRLRAMDAPGHREFARLQRLRKITAAASLIAAAICTVFFLHWLMREFGVPV
jgi:hypothetical protein